MIKTRLPGYLCSPIASLDMILSFKWKTKALRLHGCRPCTKNKTIYLTFKQFINSPLSIKIIIPTHHLYFFIPSDSPNGEKIWTNSANFQHFSIITSTLP